MKSNVIAFDRARKTTRREAVSRPATELTDKNVVSLEDWKSKTHARRTASGVFFTTSVLATLGSVA